MKFEIEIDEKELQLLILEKVSEKAARVIFGEEDYSLPFEKRAADLEKRRKAVLDKIDWKNASSQISDIVIKKFFNDMFNKTN